MTLRLAEGQDFSASYSLLTRVSQGDGVENWLCLDKASQERILLKIFDRPVAEATWAQIEQGISACRGLIHPNITRVQAAGHAGEHEFIVCPYVGPNRNFAPRSEHLAEQWPILEQLFDAIIFAHGLGLAHGHLHPGNLLVDNAGRLHITDFGLPARPDKDGAGRNWLSPQIIGGQTADLSDDVYSIGCLLYLALTGRQWRREHGFETNSPIPEDVKRLVSSMLSESTYDRPRDLAHARDVIRRYVFGEGNVPLRGLESFSRPTTGGNGQPAAPQRLASERRLVSAPVAYAGFVLLIAVAATVFYLLPERATIQVPAPMAGSDPAPGQQVTRPQAKEEPVLTPLEIARQKRFEQQGSDIATKLLRLQVELEDQGVQIWAPEKYNQVLDYSADGDTAYRDKDYEHALELYQKGVDVLQSLRAGIDTVKSDNIEAGNAALLAGDFESAIKAFTIVNAITPDSDAKRQLERAENLETVLALVKDGEFLESEGKLDDARDKIAQAVDLDSKWQPARTALARIKDKLAKRSFNDAMSIAFTALADEQYDKARAAFERAQKILPNSKEPGDGLQQIEIAQRKRAIDAYRKSATAAVDAEEWDTAIDAYRKILDLDSTLVFATTGLDQARDRLALEKELNRYLAQPTLLSSDEELSRARGLVADATRVEGPGPRLTRQIDDLSQLISLARIPVSVKLQSDNLTDVTVYKVGHLGRLESTSIELLPGRYKIVGQRRGYRDVEYELTLVGGRHTDPVYISCTEKI